ncbi:MAG TPA: class I SAM-dependent methyltransferase [Pirellulales bacterium]|jgi:SAM-dependent methyltransferase|nr:class I SAM-dependent methyltransferase [Pirellulales bacterium]
MVHSPCCKERAADPPLSADELQRAAEAAGQRLADDLQRVADATEQFAERELAAALVDAALSRCLVSLTALNCWGRDNQLPSARLWSAAGAWLEAGWLQHRARFKPAGYAGDYELLTRLWHGTCAPDPLGWAFDQFFQRQAAVAAVRSRIAQSAAALADHLLLENFPADGSRYKIVSIGCGPAIELAELARLLPDCERRRLEIVLLDLDSDALEFARAGLAAYLPAEQVACHRENLFRLSGVARLSPLFEGARAVVCLGLFDYLADEPAARLLSMIWQALQPGGLALIGNFAPHCPSRAYMEWIGNWYLIYRTAGELANLARCAGLTADCFTITAEHSGCDLFISARKPRS